jgi:hypothetical protein
MIPVDSKLHANLLIHQLVKHVAKGGGRAEVSDRDDCPLTGQAEGDGLAGTGEANHQNPLISQFDHAVFLFRGWPFLRKYPSRISETNSERERRFSRASRRALTTVSRFNVRLTRVGLRKDLGLAIAFHLARLGLYSE